MLKRMIQYFLGNIKEMFSLYYMHCDKSNTHISVLPVVKGLHW